MTDKKKKFLKIFLPIVFLIGFTATASSPAIAAETEQGEPQFPIKAYRVEGNSLLDAGEIEHLLQPYTGATRSFADIEAAREALQGAYLDAGYSTVQVTLPEQELQHGVVAFRVVEAHLVAVRISAGRHYDSANVQRSLPALVVGQAPNMHRVDQELALANENPGKYTTVVLHRGTQPDTINAGVDVKESKPWRAFLTLDNSGNAQTGNFRLGIGYQYANVANRDQVLTLQYITSPGHYGGVQAYGAGYHIPLYELGDSIDVFAGYANVNAGTVAQLFNVTGKGSVFGLRYNQHVGTSTQYTQRIIYGIDYRAYRNDISFAGTPIGADVTVHPLSLGYKLSYRGTQSLYSLSVTGMQNIPGGAHGTSTDFALASVGASADYRLLQATVDYRCALPGDWQVRLAGSGQYTTQPLVPSEQFGLGGLHSVRGFDERQFTGDKGFQGQVEFYSPDIGQKLPVAGTMLRGLIFYDAGYASLNDPQPGDIASTDISSLGFGLRMSVAKHMNLELDYAHILRAGSTDLAYHNRVQGSLTLVY